MSLTLTYKKYLNVPSVTETVYFPPGIKSFDFGTFPNWLSVILDQPMVTSQNGDLVSAVLRFTLNSIHADNLTPGLHIAQVRPVYYNEFDDSAVGPRFTVNVEIIDNVILRLSKSDFTFEYQTGSAVPATQPLTITTENAWSIIANEPWVTFSANNGNTTQTINLGVDVSGMAVGIYEATFQVDDGDRVKQGKVTLVISGTDQSDDYLRISKTSLSFSEIFQLPPTRSASFTVETSLAATVSTNLAWLNLDQENLAAGTHSLIANTQNTAALAIGTYTGTIKIESGFGAKLINVLLRIVEVSTSGIESGKLYFAADRNTLVLSSGTPNAEALINFESTVKNYQRRIPFFKDLAEVIIGLETSNFLQPNNLPDQLAAGIFVPVVPFSLNFTVYDKLINDTTLTERQSFAQVQFLNGRSPEVENKLCFVPEKITLPKDGKFCFSFFSEDPINQVNLTGDITENISSSNLSTNVYSVMIDLSNYNLSPKDQIKLTAGTFDVDITIKPSELKSFQLIFLNEWQCPEVFNMDGEIEITKSRSRQTNSKNCRDPGTGFLFSGHWKHLFRC